MRLQARTTALVLSAFVLSCDIHDNQSSRSRAGIGHQSAALSGSGGLTAAQSAINFAVPDAKSWVAANGCIGCHRGNDLFAGAAAATASLNVDLSTATGLTWLATQLVATQSAEGSWQTPGYGPSGSGTRFAQTAAAAFQLASLSNLSVDDARLTNVKQALRWLQAETAGTGSYSPPVVASPPYTTGRYSITLPNDGKLLAGQTRPFIPQDDGTFPETNWILPTAETVVASSLLLQNDMELAPTEASTLTSFEANLADALEAVAARSTLSTLSVQDLSFMSLAMAAAGRLPESDATVAALKTELVSRKLPDAGWADPAIVAGTPDALSTAEAVYALCKLGTPSSDPAIDGGLTWLSSNQGPNGSWSVPGHSSDLANNFATAAFSCAYGAPVTAVLSTKSAAATTSATAPQTFTSTLTLSNTTGSPATCSASLTGGTDFVIGSIAPATLSVSPASQSTATLSAMVAAGAPAGVYPFTVTTQCAAGASQPRTTQTFNLTVGAGAGSTPTTTSLAAGTDLTPGAPINLLARVTQAGAPVTSGTVTYYVNRSAIGTATFDSAAAGFALTAPLPAAPSGAQLLTAFYSGNAALAPSSAQAVANVNAPPAPVITAPVSGSTSTSTSITLSGTAVPGSVVSLFDNGQQLATANADKNGAFTSTVSLFFGSHSLTAQQSAFGLSAPSSAVNVTVAPAAQGAQAPLSPPSITSPANNASVSGTSVTISGTASASASVTLYDGGTTIATVAANASGSFSTTATLALGSHSLTATQTVSGQTSSASTAVSINVLPTPPSITNPANNASYTTLSAPVSVTVSGTATANAPVTISDGSTSVASLTANASGSFSTTLTLALGSHPLTATQTVSGYTSLASATVTVLVQPPPPSITSPASGASYVASPSNASVTVSGTAQPSVSVTLYDGSTSLTSVTADASGNFTGTISLSLGTHSITAKQTISGQASAASTAVSISVTPAPPAITSPTNGTNTVATTGTTVALNVSGTCASGATVNIYDGATSAGSASAMSAGTFTLPLSPAIGVHNYTATQTVSGQTSPASSPAVVLTISPPPTFITAPADKVQLTSISVSVTLTGIAGASAVLFEGSTTLGSYTIGSAGTATGTITLAYGVHSLTTQQTYNGVTSALSSASTVTIVPVAPSITAPANNARIVGTTATVTGTAVAGATLTSYVDGSTGGTLTADGSGNVNGSLTLAYGSHSVYFTQTVNGQTSAQTAPITVTMAPAPPVITSPANNATQNVPSVTVTGTAIAGASVAILDGTATLASLTATASGQFSSTFKFAASTHTFTATQTVASVTSAASAAVKLTIVDNTAPVISGTPANQTHEATGPGGIAATWTQPTATDDFDASVSVVCAPSSGATFPVGVSTVTCTAKDSSNNSSSVSFTITVTDTTPPTLTLPADITTEASGDAGTVVTYATSAYDVVDGPTTVTCTPASGSTFPITITTVSCSSTDAHGNKATGSFHVTVKDTTPPSLMLPANSVAEATSASGATLTYNASANDSVDGATPVTCTPPSGSTFPITTTTVTCSSTDSHGNKTTGTFTITVRDTTPPVVTVPSTVTAEATGPSGATVTFTASATDSVDGATAVTCSPASGAVFPLGTSTVICSSTDAHNNSNSKSFSVVVQDTTPPVITVPSNVTVEAANSAGGVANFTATATDLVDGARTVSCTPSSGTRFPVGTTTVTCTASDTRGNKATATFTVTVRDTTPPVITVPANQSVEATSANGAVVSYTVTAYDSVDGTITPTCSPASGTTFPLGTTTVSCSAIDNHGNQSTASFKVTVKDTTPPIITPVYKATYEATGPTGAVATFSATATDIVDGSTPVSCMPASGSMLPLGTTTVTCTSTDSHNNTGTTSFSIQVKDTTPPTLTLPMNITAEATSASGAVVTFGTAASDLVDGATAVTCLPASGNTFSQGQTVVTCSSTDAHNNTATGTFLVTVVDTTAPALTLPMNITAEATGASGAAVTYTATSTDAVDGKRNASCTPASGNTFPLGVTTVNCSATDSSGNKSTGSFTITVRDTTPPALALPGDLSIEATSLQGAIVTYFVSATDLVDGAVTATCTPASGTLFSPTTTTVRCTATDAAKNTASGSFKVTVKITPPSTPSLVGPANSSALTSGSVQLEWTASTAVKNTTVTYIVTLTQSGGSTITQQVSTNTVYFAGSSSLANGTYTWSVVAKDSRGVISGSSPTWSFTVSGASTPDAGTGSPDAGSGSPDAGQMAPPPIIYVPPNQTVEAVGPSGNVITFNVTASDATDGSVPVTCTPASGSTFPIGDTQVLCIASDSVGNQSAATFHVIVQDTTPPTLNVQVASSVEATGPSGAVVTYTATATDIVDGTDPVTCTPASGSTFPLGQTQVTCTTTDAAGNGTATLFYVQVQDTQPPTLTVPMNITAEATGSAGAQVMFNATATDTVDTAPFVTCSPVSGSLFPVGTTTVTCTARDASRNKATGTFNVTVVDTTPPMLVLPMNITAEATSAAGAVVTYKTPVALDTVDGALLATCTPASGGTFPLGITTVNCTSTDSHGNTASGSFTIAVQDTTPPVLNIPGGLAVEGTSQQGAVVTFLTAATDLVDGSVAVACTPPSGSTFPVGTTTVSCTANDMAMNTAQGSFQVTVKLTPPSTPTLITPANSGMLPYGSVQFLWSTASSARGTTVSYLLTLTPAGGMPMTQEVVGTSVLLTGAMALPAGSYSWSVVAVDSRGVQGTSTAASTFTIAPPPMMDAGSGMLDAGAPDAGMTVADAGDVDAGPMMVDAGTPVDAGDVDAGVADAGTSVDAGDADAGAPVDAGTLMVDAGVADAGVGDDAGPSDAGELMADAGPADGGSSDVGAVDAGADDAGPVDAGGMMTDAGSTMSTTDAGSPQTTPDAGQPSPGMSSDGGSQQKKSGGCASGGNSTSLGLLIGLAVLGRRRKAQAIR